MKDSATVMCMFNSSSYASQMTVIISVSIHVTSTPAATYERPSVRSRCKQTLVTHGCACDLSIEKSSAIWFIFAIACVQLPLYGPMCPDIPSLIVVHTTCSLQCIARHWRNKDAYILLLCIITSPWGIVYVRLYLFVTFSAMISWDNDYSYCRR